MRNTSLLALIALLINSACSESPARAAAPTPVRLGSKAFTESVILGEIATALLRAQGIPTIHRRQLGGTTILFSALTAGEIDAYPDYTGTLTQEILRGTDQAALPAALAARGVAMTAPLGFEDSYALGMKSARATALGIARISDLASHPELRLAFSSEFMARADGWPALRARYQLPQRNVRGVDHEVAYRGLESGDADVVDLYTTDPEIPEHDLRVLEDDRHQFPSYAAVFLYRAELATRAPAALAALRLLQGRISTPAMIALNARAKRGKVPETSLAAKFVATTFPQSIERAPPPPGPGLGAGSPPWLGDLAQRTVEHLFLVAVSLFLAILVGLPLGIAAARRPILGRAILAVTGIFQTIPSLALLVFMIPLLGIGSAPAIVALFLYSLLPIVRNTHAGLRGVPPPLREVATALGLHARAALRLIELPLASPAILAGIKTAAVINVGTATLGALIGAGGYGQPILTGIRLDDTRLILEGALPAAALALLVERLFDLVEKLVVPRGLRLPG
ncbi:MAG TPA: glycine betaine ABC transporter substrate-binding protein [Polyangia bacterium]|nr:glycine betaine ABC transporter substrate-binding protein [Polyangia bacterium]